MASIKCLSLKSGHNTLQNQYSEYALCQSRKLLDLISPLVLITMSGSGIPWV
jgi:hypothetical protein